MPFDAAQARAEIELLKFLNDELPNNRAYWDGMDEGETGPRFYRKAREYVRTVFVAYIENRLHPDVNDPVLAVADVDRFAKDVTRYLWIGHGFSGHTDYWNISAYPQVVKDWPVKGGEPRKLSFIDFQGSIWLDSIGGEMPLSDMHKEVIERFWHKRGMVSGAVEYRNVGDQVAGQGSAPNEPVQLEQASAKSSRKVLRDAYFAKFPEEKIKILDVCWAVGQHYREWKRWVNGEAKDDATADLAFRRILMSEKRPLDYNRKPRPNNWQ